MAHVRTNWANSAEGMANWFEGEGSPALGHAHWNHTVKVNGVEVIFADFPVNLVEEAKKRNGRLPKYMRRIAGAYLAAAYPALREVTAEDRKEFSRGLAKALGLGGEFALEGKFHYAGAWLETAARKVTNVYTN